jgi:membrane-associated phospholipid phosphatase
METSMFWIFVSRFGEAQILLPATLGACLWLAHRDESRPVVIRWLAWMSAAAIVTTITKVAYMGWGIGSATLDFTGISGHAMFASAVYPPLLFIIASSRSPAWKRVAWLAGFVLALMIGVSRVMVEAHSWSEVIAGLAIGCGVSVSTLWMARTRHPSVPLWLPLGMAAWLAIMPVHAPASTTHDMVTRLALKLSGRHMPHTRADLHRINRIRSVDFTG